MEASWVKIWNHWLKAYWSTLQARDIEMLVRYFGNIARNSAVQWADIIYTVHLYAQRRQAEWKSETVEWPTDWHCRAETGIWLSDCLATLLASIAHLGFQADKLSEYLKLLTDSLTTKGWALPVRNSELKLWAIGVHKIVTDQNL